MKMVERNPYSHSASVGRKVRGFTLIELVVVVAIVAILATIAFASYQSSITKSRRAAAANCLQGNAQFMERYYTTHMSYFVAATPPVLSQCQDLGPFYTVGFEAGPTPTAYTLRAVPLASQLANDTLCGTLSLTQQGVRGETGTGTPNDCW